MIRPEAHLQVARAAGERDALIHELCAEVVSPCRWIDEQDPKLRRRRIGGDTEHATYPATVDLRDPGRLAARVVLVRVVRDDLGHQRLEARVPTELARV